MIFSISATEEFDELCFEFGLELDEDVCYVPLESYASCH